MIVTSDMYLIFYLMNKDLFIYILLTFTMGKTHNVQSSRKYPYPPPSQKWFFSKTIPHHPSGNSNLASYISLDFLASAPTPTPWNLGGGEGEGERGRYQMQYFLKLHKDQKYFSNVLLLRTFHKHKNSEDLQMSHSWTAWETTGNMSKRSHSQVVLGTCTMIHGRK